MAVSITVGNVRSKLSNVPNNAINIISQELSVRVPNCWFSAAYKTGGWDGYQRFLTRPANVFPTGLLPKVVDVLNDMELPFVIEDTRQGVEDYQLQPINEDYHISAAKKARDYQVETINKVITSNINGVPFVRGIINIATNGGKTVIAEGIIRELYPQLQASNEVLLFVTHSKEIARQARKSIMTDLNIPVGMIGDGKWELETVTVAIVTTLYKRMKDKKPEWNELQPRVRGFIADECLPWNSLIMLPDWSSRTIQEVYENPKIDYVMSYNTQHKQIECKRIVRKIRSTHDGRFDVLNVGGTSLVATSSHKVYTVNRGYIPLSELHSDDTILRVENYTIAAPASDGSGGSVINKIYNSMTPVLRERVGDSIHSEVFSGEKYEYRYNLEVEGNHNYFANGVLVSNCHHSSSDSWYNVFSSLPNALIRLGLTGTIDKTKPVQEMKLYACTGGILNKVSNDYLIQNGYSAKPKCIMFKITSPELERLDYSEAYQLGIVENDERNRVICDICDKETTDGNKVLILIEHLDQGEILEKVLEDINKHVYFTNGQLSSDVREELLNKLRNGELDVLISSNILDEGIDISGINAVIYARGMKSMRKILQGIGRGLRVKEDGSVLRFYDFIDDTHSKLLEHSSDRYKTLKSEKFDIKLLDINKYKTMSWNQINR